MESPIRVRRVSAVSTGTVDIHPEHAFGSWKPMYLWILTSRRWLRRRPIYVYAVEHADGLVLFDTGQDRASVVDPDYFPGGAAGVVYDRLARFDIEPGETLERRLAAIGYDARDVRTVVLSHLHQDHIGGLAAVSGAEIVVSAAEWASLERPGAELRGLLRAHIRKPGLRFRRIDFAPTSDPDLAPFDRAYDLRGDGSLMLLPTPGHTEGSMSMLIRHREGPPILLVGDLTYACDRMDAGTLPGVGQRRALGRSTERVLALKRRWADLAILAAHDPAAAEELRRADAGARIARRELAAA